MTDETIDLPDAGAMDQTPEEWLEELFEFETCAECGGDAAHHVVCLVPGIGNYFARCRRSPFADTTGEGDSPTPSSATATVRHLRGSTHRSRCGENNIHGAPTVTDPYRSIKLPHLVRDALYNAHTDNIRHEMDVRYGTGVILGVVSMVMAVNECNLTEAIGAVRGILAGQQQRVDRRCIPDCWRELWPT